jgi:hypothetical protein
MKLHPIRIPRAWTAILVMLLVCGGASAGPPVMKADGGGTFESGGALNTVGFTARIDTGGAVKGEAQFQLRGQGLRLHVVVDCLSVLANEAWIGGIVLTSSDPTLVGTHVTWRVQDNGEGDGAVDQVSLPVPGAASDCVPQPALPLLSLAEGDIQVE